MFKTKKVSIFLLITIVTALLSFAFLNSLDAFAAQGVVIRPHDSDLALEVTYDSVTESITVTTTGSGLENYQYQFWIKTKVPTDNNNGNLVVNQYIWQVAQGFTSSEEADIVLTDDKKDNSEKYNIIVRVKKTIGGAIVDELFTSFSAQDIGKPVITGISINGNTVFEDSVIVYRNSAVNIVTTANIDGLNYKLYLGNSETPAYNGKQITASLISAGEHKMKMVADDGAGKFAVKEFTVYVMDVYQADSIPVITSLQGIQNGSIATFFMQLKYADGASVSIDHFNNFNFMLKSGTIGASAKNPQKIGDYLQVEFDVNYGSGKYGIYQTIATVSRKAITGTDDKVIQYYKGFSREATLTLTGSQDSAILPQEGFDYTSITITAESGKIKASKEENEQKYVNETNLRYSFYREDASGWVLIKDYGNTSDDNSFVWTPTKAGIYNIQTRVKDINSGSYEATATKTFTITSTSLQGDLSIIVYDYETGLVAEDIYAGKPYKLYANYTGSEDVLYMFTMKTENLGLVYLNKFNPSAYLMFVPSKVDDFVITARVISKNSFGYKDKSKDLAFSSSIQVLDSNDLFAKTPLVDGTFYSNIGGYAMRYSSLMHSSENNSTESLYFYGDNQGSGTGWPLAILSLPALYKDLTNKTISFDIKFGNLTHTNMVFYIIRENGEELVGTTAYWQYSKTNLADGWINCVFSAAHFGANLTDIAKIKLGFDFEIKAERPAGLKEVWMDNLIIRTVDTIDEKLVPQKHAAITQSINFYSKYTLEDSNSSVKSVYTGTAGAVGYEDFLGIDGFVITGANGMALQNLLSIQAHANPSLAWQNAVLTYWIYNDNNFELYAAPKLKCGTVNIGSWNTQPWLYTICKPNSWTQVYIPLKDLGITSAFNFTAGDFNILLIKSANYQASTEYSFKYYIDGFDIVSYTDFAFPLLQPNGDDIGDLLSTMQLSDGAFYNSSYRRLEYDSSVFSPGSGNSTVSAKFSGSGTTRDAIGPLEQPNALLSFGSTQDLTGKSIKFDIKFDAGVSFNIYLKLKTADGTMINCNIAYWQMTKADLGNGWSRVTLPVTQFSGNLTDIVGINAAFDFVRKGSYMAKVKTIWLDNLKIS